MPSAAYIQALGNALQMPADALTPTRASFAPAPTAYVPVDPLASLPPPPAKPDHVGYDPLTDKTPAVNPIDAGIALGQQRGEIPLPAAPPGPGPGPGMGPAAAPSAGGSVQGPDPHTLNLQQVGGGGMTRAREVDMRGPSLTAAQGRTNAALESATGSQEHRSINQAEAEYGTYLQQERDARTREQAAQQSVAERDEELATRQADFDSSVKNLSKMTMDRDRWFASRSTPQKIFAFLELGLAGFRGAPSMVMQRIDADVKAQEFAYGVAKDTVEANKTAFGMAMQKYQNADAARAMVRAAALDAAQAQTAQLGALGKGTQAANHADAMMVALEEQKMNQIAQGIRFLPPTLSGRLFQDPKTGLIYTEKEAKELAKEMRTQQFEQEKQLTGIGGDLAKEDAHARASAAQNLGGETRFIAEKMQSAGIPQMRALTEEALRALQGSRGGLGEAAARGVLNTPSLGGGVLTEHVMSEKSNAREQAFQAFANLNMNQLSGGAISPAEEVRLKKQLGSGSSPEARERALRSVLAKLDAAEKSIKAGTSPAAQARYNEQRLTAEGAPQLVPKGASEGWK